MHQSLQGPNKNKIFYINFSKFLLNLIQKKTLQGASNLQFSETSIQQPKQKIKLWLKYEN